jgi:hypothetical protein
VSEAAARLKATVAAQAEALGRVRTGASALDAHLAALTAAARSGGDDGGGGASGSSASARAALADPALPRVRMFVELEEAAAAYAEASRRLHGEFGRPL